MNYGPLVFLAAFFALAGSWFGFVLTPTAQLGRLRQTNSVPAGPAYPVARPGLAAQGLEVYRANGCAECHSQEVGQSGTQLEVVLTEPGTNRSAVASALRELTPSLRDASADPDRLLQQLPLTLLKTSLKDKADAAATALRTNGAKAHIAIVPVGPDIARGWGIRRTVAEDYLYDYPVLLGSVRVGPDLANVGVRLPNPAWHLRHLYAPRAEVAGSTMPPYRFLFEEQRPGSAASPDALKLSKKFNPSGAQIIPTAEARALVAYLLSLRADAPLFSAPLSVASAAGTVMASNAPTASGPAATNAAPSEGGTK